MAKKHHLHHKPMRGNKTMSEVIVEAPVVVVPDQKTFWARVGDTLKSWGNKLKAAVKKVGNWIVSGAKWLWDSAPVKWVASKAKFAGKWIWGYAKGPVGWILAPIAAFLVAPKAVAILLLGLILAVILIAVLVYGIYRAVSKYSPEEIQEVWADAADRVLAPVSDIVGAIELADEPAPTADETIESRYGYLEQARNAAEMRNDAAGYSEYTARLNLLVVRRGNNTQLPKDARVTVVHRNTRKEAAIADPSFDWDWARMYNAARSEDARLKEVARLKAEQANLTSV